MKSLPFDLVLGGIHLRATEQPRSYTNVVSVGSDRHQRPPEPAETGREKGKPPICGQCVSSQGVHLELRSDTPGESHPQDNVTTLALHQISSICFLRHGRTPTTRTGTQVAAETMIQSIYVT